MSQGPLVVRTACALCQNFCGVLAYVQGGRIVKLEGDPQNPRNEGHLCAKGLSSHLSIYSPKRVKRPLLRTNPKKGIGIDPQWKEIGWEEALDIIAEKVKRIRSNPKGYRHKVLFITFDYWSAQYGAVMGFMNAMQAYHGGLASPCFCGNAVHPPSYLNTATFEITPDAKYARYILLIGAQAGSIIHYDTMSVAREIASKRPGEIKVVAIDPLCSYAASKAEEWIPIRPGTDTALILSLVHLLVNEYGIYDEEFLKKGTNAPYLVGPDGRYCRDPTDGKPLVWDPSFEGARPFDQASDFSLEGYYTIDGIECRPAFQRLKEHVRKYTPEFASEVTTIPVTTIRRLAKEIGEAASIGSTIILNGKEFPYRPVSIVWYRGLSAHRHSFLAGLAALLLPTLLGAIQVPGGIRGHPSYQEYVSGDGLMAIKLDPLKGANSGTPYPPRPVKKPSRIDVIELFPVAPYSRPMIIPVLLEPSKFGLEEDIVPELAFIARNNFVKNTFKPELVVEAFKRIPFIVALALELDETTNSLADLVLPEVHNLERLAENLYVRIGEPGYWYCAKPAVKPPFEPPYDGLVSYDQLLLEVAKRAGFLGECYEALNDLWGLRGTPYELDPNAEYSYLELVDRRLKSWLGDDKGLEWLLSQEGGLLRWSPDPEELYRGRVRQGRLHIYYEFLLEAGRQVESVVKELGLPWDVSDYQPLPDWKPCPAYERRGEDFDLFVINYKVPIQIHSFGRFNPLLTQLVLRHGCDAIIMNAETAKRKGIEDGDEVIVETIKGRRSKCIVRLSERVHPEVIASLQHTLGSGADFNELLTLDQETLDFLGCAVDSCILARVTKA